MNNVFSMRTRSNLASVALSSQRRKAGELIDNVIQFNRSIDDEQLLRRVAPWISEVADPVSVWRHSLIFARLSAQIDRAMGSPTLHLVSWRPWGGGNGTDFKGTVGTEFGRIVIILMVSKFGARAIFEGSQEALFHAGIAHEHLMNRGHRKFEANAFDAIREVRVTRNGEIRHVVFELTAEEFAQIQSADAESLATAKAALREELAQLPRSSAEYHESFSRFIAVVANMLVTEANSVSGGFSLSPASRSAVIAQAEMVRGLSRTSAVQANRTARVRDISKIAAKHAPQLWHDVQITNT